MNKIMQPSEIDAEAQQDMNDLDSGALGNSEVTCPNPVIEYGVFFDGTGNNADNFELGIEKRAAGENTRGSYNNDRTNVWKLSQVYDENPDFNDCGGIGKIREVDYIEGVGTSSGKRDNLVGNAMGTGPTGVAVHVQEAFLALKNFLLNQTGRYQISEVKIDVFGFSRGSAAARYFVNVVNAGECRDVVGTYGAASIPLTQAYPGAKDFIALDKIKIRFLGLFDTVPSVGFVADDDNNGIANVNLNSSSAEKIYHITALDEFRRNFSLKNIKGSGGEEVRIPGAHSDVGGGYAAHNKETIHFDASEMIPNPKPRLVPVSSVASATPRGPTGLIPVGTERSVNDFNADRNGGTPIDVEQRLDIYAKYRNDIERLISEGWITRAEFSQAIKPGGEYFVLSRPWVDHRLSRVALHMMHKKALESEVPFAAVLPENDDYALPSDLVALEAQLYAGIPVTPAQHRQLRHDYVHYSSHIKPVFGVAPMIAQDGNKRGEFDNDAGEAISR